MTTQTQTKTRSTFGKVSRMRSGRYQAKYMLDGQWHTAPKTYEAQEDARAWLEKERTKLTEAPQTKKPRGMTFKELAEHFLANKRTRNGALRPGTVQNYRISLERVIYPTFEDVPIKSITMAMVDDWYESNSKTPPRALSKAYATLHAILGYAVDKRWLETNPAHIRGAGQAQTKIHPRPVDAAEIDKIIGAMPDNMKAMVLLASWCALRFGELVALTRDDIDLKAKTVSVTKNAVRVKGETIIARPKTDAGIRTVPMPQGIIKAIKHHLVTYVGPERDALLFAGPMSNKPMQPSHFRKYFMLATLAAGRPEITGPHELRRAGLTLFAQAGATIAELQARAGHASPDAAMIYQAATAARATEVTERMDALAKVNKSKKASKAS